MNAMAEPGIIYTDRKTASTEEEREKARQEYLDRRGIPDGFPMVTVLVDYHTTGAWHACIVGRQGTACRGADGMFLH
ncbi:MAG: hypothetical protein ACLURP_12175 [Ruminococcus sp.]